jgi:hypothetical protein
MTDLELRNRSYALFVRPLGVEGHIESSCPDCGEALAFETDRPGELFFHCLLPAAHWWSDIGYT